MKRKIFLQKSVLLLKHLEKKMQAGQWKKKKTNPQHFKVITLVLQSINIHTSKMSCKRWANDKMMY